MKSGNTFLILFSLLAAASYAQDQNISFEHFSYENGLSAPVTHIVQDKYGFLWLGTTDGINRFDGKNFIVYRNIPGDTTSLSNNIINSMAVDQSGRVWAATNGGLCYYDFSVDAFHRIDVDDRLEKIDRHRVLEVTISKDSSVWFATRTLLHVWRKNEPSKTIQLPLQEGLIISHLLADNYGNIWIGTNTSRIYMFDVQKQKFIYSPVTSSYALKENFTVNVHPIVKYKKDTLLFGSWYGGMQKAFYDGNSITCIPLIDSLEKDARGNIVQAIAKGDNTKWWIGTYGTGLAFFDENTQQFSRHIHHDPANSKSLSSDYINEIFMDASGIIWVGTINGLDKFDLFTQQFLTVPIPEFPQTETFSVYRSPSSFIEDIHDSLHQGLWMTVSGFGLVHYNKSTQEFKLYNHDERNPNSLPDNRVRSLYYDDKNRLWIGMKTGVCLFDQAAEKFSVPEFPHNVIPVSVNKIFADRRGRYWFSSSTNGVYCYDEHGQKLTSWQYVDGNPASLPDDHVFAMLEDHEGKMWIGTQNNGLCRLDPQTDEFLFFMNDKKNPNSLPDNGIYDLFEDSNRHLWIATENGFADMDLSDYSMKIYTTKDGLSNNNIFSITQDHRNHLWLATNNGISDFDPVKRTFKNYFMNSGLPAGTIDGAAYCDSEGTLWFASRGMISFCRPQNMKVNKRVPPVVITGFKIFDKPVPVMRIEGMLQPLELSYRQSMFTFDFAALNFTNPFMNQYAYKLEGFDRDWIYCGNKQSATYTNLNGGNYTFHVKAANNDGMWNEQGVQVQLTISPPYWKTWWFYLLCLLTVAAILFSIYRIRISQIIRLQQIRMRIARDLHDDIGSTLSSINMISSMAHKASEPEKKSSDIFNTISSASRQAMELMNDIVWSINPKNDRMEMIFIRMRQYASEMLEAAHISFTLEMDDETKHVTLPVEKRKDFYLIFKEAINNLAKYSRASEAHIKINYTHRSLILTISDNGIGFSSVSPGEGRGEAGNGLKNMQARTEQLKGEMKITSNPGEGTCVDLRIPVSP